MPACPTVTCPKRVRRSFARSLFYPSPAAIPAALLAVLVFAGLPFVAGCSGSGGKAATDAVVGCGDDAPGVVCLSSCNLGCTETGCGRTEIAQNEFVVLTFSEELDANTVNNSSILFRTASGDEAVGEYLVTGNRVEFVPSLLVSGGQTFYGFTNGETYVMTIVGGDDSPSVVRGTSGRAFGETLRCTLESRRGIIDYDEQPPTAVLSSPSQSSDVPLDSAITIEFSELIDVTPFLNAAQSPVQFFVRRAFVDGNGEAFCNTASDRQPLVGSQFPTFDVARGVTVLAFQPAMPLPGNACVEIDVSAEVADLSGRAAVPQAFSFFTERVVADIDNIREDFSDQNRFDRDQSAAIWQGGQLAFATIGGDGRHGRFDLDLLDPPTLVDGLLTYTIDCDQTVIPAQNTTTGAPIVINDGRFFFTEFVLPASANLRFVGSSPPIVTACGRVEILGSIDVSGGSLVMLPTPSGSGAGSQPGALGGVFGGRGGRGAAQCLGDGVGSGEFSGFDGEDTRLLTGHAYASTRLGSGGRGSSLFPVTGLDGDRQFAAGGTTVACASMVAGGGGGGSSLPGEIGRVLLNNVPEPVTGAIPWLAAFGPETPAANALTLLPYPGSASALPSSQHFLVGGAGGGGSASNAAYTLNSQTNPVWAPGGAGAGGGGCLALRAGQAMRIGSAGRLRAVGGSTPDSLALGAIARAMPGGGGAGGSLVLQCPAPVDLFGQFDVRGGRGGLYDREWATPPLGASIRSKAGDGAPGLVRLEAPAVDPAVLQAVVADGQGFISSSELFERDEAVACQSLFYSTGLALGPVWSSYRIEAMVDGIPMTFSDDPSTSAMQATQGAPVRALFQAGTIDLVTGVVDDLKPWRTLVRPDTNQETIASDALNAVRFRLIVDRTLAQQVVITEVVFVFLN